MEKIFLMSDARTQRTACTCARCGAGIMDGASRYEMDGEQYHVECFEGNAVDILLDECGAFKVEGKPSRTEPDVLTPENLLPLLRRLRASKPSAYKTAVEVIKTAVSGTYAG